MDELMRLSNATLSHLPAGIARPLYDRSALTPGIIHIGVGNFHRAHQSWYLHRLMQAAMALDWGIVGAGVRTNDAAMRERLLSQDCLTTLIELDPAGTSAEVVGSMIDYVPVEDRNSALIHAIANPRIRIASLTVTEGGYYIDPVTKQFDGGHVDIQHDVEHPDAPKTAFGAIVAALKHRRDGGFGPVSLMSCDNLQGNGKILRDTVVSLASLIDDDLASWINETCSFPNSMVDCIVPATGEKEIALAHKLGIEDAAPVTHENFRQWVIEDDFCAGRPDWDQVGATFSADVHAYETMKIRVLNAGHQVLANPGEILGIGTIDGCMANAAVRDFFLKVETDEILPQVHPVPGISPEAYLDLIATRFENPKIGDTTRRVAFDGSSRHTGFVLPILRDRLNVGAPIEGLALVEALWARMCFAERENGSHIEANDPMWGELSQAAHDAKTDPSAWLAQTTIYGDLKDAEAFASAFSRWLKTIWAEGTEATLRHYVGNSA
ncbi:MAG: mannitol dehydrogenase family protein [Pseudomonadota bacterium]